MPTLMPFDTAAALGPNAEKCDSRSLLLDRFVYEHADMDEARKLHFSQVCADSFGAIRKTREGWQATLNDSKAKPDAKAKAKAFLEDTEGLAKRTATVGPALIEAHSRKTSAKVEAHARSVAGTPSCATLHAQLQSRLMVNMAGGVMENAGLCLDRFGLPYIPGSAVKGCARRAALAALHEWCTAGGQPAHKPAGQNNPLAPCSAPFTTPAEMLVAIARVFGWCELDWSDRSNQSDFRWACARDTATLKTAAETLAAHFRWPIEDRHRDTPWLSLPNFAGSVSFLPAYPVDLGKTGRVDGLPLDVPAIGKLELDVVTCHHRDYYASDNPNAVATDTEEPVPVVFPAVAPGHVFTFALVPLRSATDRSYPSNPSAAPKEEGRGSLRNHVRRWLKTGLEVFGLGAKTSAGYGWFADVTDVVQPLVAAEQERLAKETAKKAAADKAAAQAAAQAAAEAERLAKAPPHEKFQAEYGKLGDEPFAAQAKKFAEMNDDQRHGFVLALKDRRDTAKRWSKKKPELLKPWQEFAQKLQPPIQLP
jgi:CRISPR type III-B/RAMP module RAMP protein Cmr6